MTVLDFVADQAKEPDDISPGRQASKYVSSKLVTRLGVKSMDVLDLAAKRRRDEITRFIGTQLLLSFGPEVLG